MEKLKDILNSLEDRFSNPLVFSFACSWLVINWQITIALFWYDAQQIKKANYSSIFEFITDKINIQDGLYHPLCFALVYTFAMPTIKNIIRAFYSWTEKWGENWNLEITKGMKIPFEKYLKFREEYDKRSEILEDVITKESENLTTYNETKTELLQAQTTISGLQQQMTTTNSFINQLYDIKLLNGYWINSYSDMVDHSLIGSEEVYIENDKYYLVDKFGIKRLVFNITNFHFDNRNRSIFFVKERVDQEKTVLVQGDLVLAKFNLNTLRIEREDLLIGRENQTTQIEYKRKAISPTTMEGSSI